MECTGTERPVVVLSAGLGTSGTTFEALAKDLAARHRVCTYDRAGLGDSPPLGRDDPAPWPGNASDALAKVLAAHGEEPPYVLLGWSYGGLVVQSFTARHGDLVAGLVLEDSSTAEQFVDRDWRAIRWEEGGRLVDTKRTARALRRTDFGDRPVVVLTADELSGRVARLWAGYHDRLTASSTDSVHVVAVDAPHAIHESNEAIVAAAVDTVASVVAEGGRLPACRATFHDVGGRCLE